MYFGAAFYSFCYVMWWYGFQDGLYKLTNNKTKCIQKYVLFISFSELYHWKNVSGPERTKFY